MSSYVDWMELSKKNAPCPVLLSTMTSCGRFNISSLLQTPMKDPDRFTNSNDGPDWFTDSKKCPYWSTDSSEVS
jgi:hypothetical protein